MFRFRVKVVRNNKKQKAGLNRSMLNNNFFETKRQFKYKADWRGKFFEQTDTYFPSSKLCHVCEHKNTKLELSDRKWICKNCKTEHDRDTNAGINIMTKVVENIINSQAGVNTPDLKQNAFDFIGGKEEHIAIINYFKSSMNGKNPVIANRRQKEYVKHCVQFANDLRDKGIHISCLLYTSPSPRDQRGSRMPSSA